LQRVLLAILGLAVFVGLTMSVDGQSEETYEGLKFTYEDGTSGNGFFAINNKIDAKGPHADYYIPSRLAKVHLHKTSHGSGSIERESIIISNESSNTQVYPAMIYAFGLVATLEDHAMVYAPQTMSVGTGYYAARPLEFNSLLSDKTQIKNYASKTYMGQKINYAHGINVDRLASVEDVYLDTGTAKNLGNTRMNIEGDVTDGTTQLVVQQGGIRKWSSPDIDIHEIHAGTFSIKTKMDLTVPIYKSLHKDYPWLSCCFSGEDDMILCDKKGLGADEEGVFDCLSDSNIYENF